MSRTLTRKVTVYVDGKEVESTLKSLKAAMEKLVAQQKTMTIGSEEYVKDSLKIKEIKSRGLFPCSILVSLIFAGQPA